MQWQFAVANQQYLFLHGERLMTHFGKLAIGMVAAGGLVLSASAWSDDDTHFATDGYANAHGMPVETLSGCLRTDRYDPTREAPECGIEMEMEPSPPKAMMTEMDIRGDALFDFDKSVVKPEGMTAIDNVVGQMGALSDVDKIVVVGHADSVGPEDYNQGLSERRADAVAAELVSRGAPSNKIQSYGVGETQPAASNSTSEGRAQNRRVEINVRGAKQG